jgi:uncharacterized membrane protein
MPDKPIDKVKTLEDELKRRDKVIEELKKENIILIRTSLKQSEQTNHWRKYAEKLEKKKTQD